VAHFAPTTNANTNTSEGSSTVTYLGEHLNQCRAVPFDWANTSLVIVSGSGPNPCGHAIANAGNFYFHVDGVRGYPWYFGQTGYQRYLRENGKRELRRRRVQLTNPDGAQNKLDELMSKKWTWLVLPNNCVAFVEEVFAAGGSKFSSYSNCPKVWA
jgi:hypothetical protein